MERNKSFLDKIGSLIPGYKGYAEREIRRQNDKILRQKIVAELAVCEKIVQNRITKEIKNRNIEQMTTLEDCRKQLNNLSSKIKYAPYGESSFFSDSQIKEVELSEIFKKDLYIMDQITIFKESIKNMPAEKIDSVVTEIDQLLDDRNQFIKEYK